MMIMMMMIIIIIIIMITTNVNFLVIILQFCSVISCVCNRTNQSMFSTNRDTAFCCTTDIFTAFYSGLVVFSIIGFMAKESGSTVEELAKVSGIQCVIDSR